MKTAVQILLILIAFVLMIGFGVCSLVGLSFGLLNNGGNLIPLLAIAGLSISGACGFWIYKIVKSMRRSSSETIGFD